MLKFNLLSKSWFSRESNQYELFTFLPLNNKQVEKLVLIFGNKQCLQFLLARLKPVNPASYKQPERNNKLRLIVFDVIDLFDIFHTANTLPLLWVFEKNQYSGKRCVCALPWKTPVAVFETITWL